MEDILVEIFLKFNKKTIFAQTFFFGQKSLFFFSKKFSKSHLSTNILLCQFLVFK